jgi:hypothetical protein
MLAVERGESVSDRGVAADDFEGLTGGAGRVLNRKQYGCHVLAWDAAGPAPAAKTTASAPRRCAATSSTEAFSRSTTTGSAPAT